MFKRSDSLINKRKDPLTPFEEERITETFKLFDKNNDGAIDEEELANILESIPSHLFSAWAKTYQRGYKWDASRRRSRK